MSDETDASAHVRRQQEAHRTAARRRRLEEIFGSTPDQTSDDLDLEGSGGSGSPGRGDDWLRAQVPPHHGG